MARRFGTSSTPRDTSSASKYMWGYLVNSSSLLQAIFRKVAITTNSKKTLSLGVSSTASNWPNPKIGPPSPVV